MLPDRYPTPITDSVFDDDMKIERWWVITRAYMKARVVLMERDDHDINADELLEAIERFGRPDAMAVRTREASTGHDVVAFLSLIEDQLEPVAKPLLHYGLTSSDLVDNGHFIALRQHIFTLQPHIAMLRDYASKYQMQTTDRAGRTHGQLASPTSWNWQMNVWCKVLDEIYGEMLDYQRDAIFKTAGPTGRNHLIAGEDQIVANYFATWNPSVRTVPSTQVVPRDYQLRWAALYLRLACHVENLALQVRLGSRSEVAEVREGATEGRVGSSAMPHKKNPIDSEKVCGLARVARGHFQAIAETVALWEDRDLTNSVVERVAVPGLAAVVEHMVCVMRDVMQNLIIDTQQMRLTINTYPEVWSATMQTLCQKHFAMGPLAASEWVNRMLTGLNDHMLTYPGPHYFLGFVRSRVHHWAGETGQDYAPFMMEFQAIVEGENG